MAKSPMPDPARTPVYDKLSKSFTTPPPEYLVYTTPATLPLTPADDDSSTTTASFTTRTQRDPSPQCNGRVFQRRVAVDPPQEVSPIRQILLDTDLRKRRYNRTERYLYWILMLMGISSVSMVLFATSSSHSLDEPPLHYKHNAPPAMMRRHSVNLNQMAASYHKKKVREDDATTRAPSEDRKKDAKRNKKQEKKSHHHDKKKPAKKRNHKSDHHHHENDKHRHHHEKKKAVVPPMAYHPPEPVALSLSEVEWVIVPRGSLLESDNVTYPEVDAAMFEEFDTDARVVQFHELEAQRDLEIELYPSDFTDNTQLYGVLDSSDEALQPMEMRAPYADETCIPMEDWQTTFHPSCNGMHELDMTGLSGDDVSLFGMNGFWRNAWKVDSGKDRIVLKTLKINHRFEDAYFENHRIDAVVLERLTASPHVINVFGFCGHSVTTEYADGKRLGELADKKRKTKLARLQIAVDIANGLADVHGIDGDDTATFVHLDINPANVVSINSTLKLNDFNIGVLRRWNVTSNEPCGIPSQYPNPQWRSPEEARRSLTLTEKVDVFSLGHIFFRLICGHEPWHKLEPGGMPSKEVLNQKVQNGILPTIPTSVMESTDPEVIAIRKAMLDCYTYEPADRPSAREIAESLASTLSELSTAQTS